MYTADALGAITNRLFKMAGAEDFDLPLFSELAYPEEKKKEPTTQEVRQHILERLKEVSMDEHIRVSSETEPRLD